MFRENHQRLLDLGAQVIGMSVESDRAHTAFAAALDIPFPLVSDFNRQVVGQFGIDYLPDEPFSGWYGMGRRSVFVLDRDARVRYAWVTDDPLVAPEIGPVLSAVEAILSASTG